MLDREEDESFVWQILREGFPPDFYLKTPLPKINKRSVSTAEICPKINYRFVGLEWQKVIN